MLKKIRKGFSLLEISLVILIIGILIAGITQASDVLRDFAVSSAKNLSRSSVVGRVDDLVFWADSLGEKSLDKNEKKDQENISVWSDSNPKVPIKSGFVAISQNLRPKFEENAINSIPGIKFAGNNCMMSDSLRNTNFDNFLVYLVFMPLSLNDGTIIEKKSLSNTSFSLEIFRSFYRLEIGRSGELAGVYGIKLPKIKQPNLIKISRIKGSTIQIEVNGVMQSVNDLLTQSTSNSDEISFGCIGYSGSPQNFANGIIGEIAMFNRNLSPREINLIDEYFYKKWKLNKYTGNQAVADWSYCVIPDNLNADPSIKNVLPTSIFFAIGCKSGYSGNLSYLCSNSGILTTQGYCSYCGSSCLESSAF